MEQRRVVITGLGAITPIGNNLKEFWTNLKNGKSGAAPITYFDASRFKTRFACEIKNYDPLNHFGKGEARKYDFFTQYALIAADEAVKAAKLESDKINKDRVGVIWGSGNGGIFTFQQEVEEYERNGRFPRFNPYLIPKMILDIASGIISMKYGFRGVNFTTVSACATSNTALIDAFNYIRWGKADVIITGGSEAAITDAGIGGFSAMKALSTHNDCPEMACRPFDKSRDGFVMGEGAGAIVLESYEHAVKRGVPILAEMAGGGMSADAYHLTATHPEGEGAQLAMREALTDAGLSASDIDYINVHATSTPTGDISELKALKALFDDHLGKIRISATKSMTGHLLGAAGAVEGIASIMAIREGIIPPTINTKELDPQVPDNISLTLGTSQRKDIQVAMSNTFGFGGHNAIVIFKKV